ncbi:MAG: hypothetical protein Q4B36_07595 [Tissierellia bacterium]|nr:hypothetical protein [Tissierellia bacterium]
MTKRHNGARILVMGSGIVGKDLARTCLHNFLNHVLVRRREASKFV